MNYKSDVEAIQALTEKYKLLKNEVAKAIVGQDEIVKNLIICIFRKIHFFKKMGEFTKIKTKVN